MRGDRPRALSHALVAGRVWCICSAYAWCMHGVTRNMCVKCHAREGTLPNLAVVHLSQCSTVQYTRPVGAGTGHRRCAGQATGAHVCVAKRCHTLVTSVSTLALGKELRMVHATP